MILRLFASAPRHPLTDARELRQIVAALPTDDPPRLVTEVSDWFESLEQVDDLREDQLWTACCALDVAAQPALRRVTQHFLVLPRRRAVNDKTTQDIGERYFGRLAGLYQRVLDACAQRDKTGAALRSEAPLIACRLLSALGNQYKWAAFRHAAAAPGFWRALGGAYLAAVDLGIDAQPGAPSAAGAPTPADLYLKTLLLAASSPDSLQPIEIELTDKVISHFLPQFVMARSNVPGMLYWADALLDQPPVRLATLPKASPGLRLISPGTSTEGVAALTQLVHKGVMPETLNLGGLYPQRQVSRVLRHIARYWSAQPPMREHRRHAVSSAIRVTHGLSACTDLYDPQVAAPAADSVVWHAENISLSGIGVRIDRLGDGWPRIGSLLGMLPEGSDKWLLGVTRRLVRHDDGTASAGIQTLAKEARLLMVHARTASGVLTPEPIRALLCDTLAASGEARLLLPGATFDSRESIEGCEGDRRVLFVPVACEESCPDYDLARYRVHVGD